MSIESKTYDYGNGSIATHPEATKMIEKLYRLAGDIQKSTLVANPGRLKLTVDFTRREVQATITSHFYISDRN